MNKENIFNELATAVDSYAWVQSNTLKEKFGTIDSEEEYQKVEADVLAYVESKEFRNKVVQEEIAILNNISRIATEAVGEYVNED